MNKENARKILLIVKEWVENEDAELYFEGNLVTWSPSFDSDPEDYKIRYPKKTITVNGVEVPAPEKKGLKFNTPYFVSSVEDDTYFVEYVWDDSFFDNIHLNRGLIYLNKEDAISRATAMLVYKEK